MCTSFIQLLQYIQAGIPRFTAVSANNRVFPCMGKHALLQMFREVVLNDEHALNNSLRSCMGT